MSTATYSFRAGRPVVTERVSDAATADLDHSSASTASCRRRPPSQTYGSKFLWRSLLQSPSKSSPVVVPCGAGGPCRRLLPGIAGAWFASPDVGCRASQLRRHPPVAGVRNAGVQCSTERVHLRRIACQYACRTALCNQSTWPEPRAYLKRCHRKTAVQLLFDEFLIVAEPGGAVAFAALIESRQGFDAGALLVIVSGGNVDAAVFSNVLTGS